MNQFGGTGMPNGRALKAAFTYENVFPLLMACQDHPLQGGEATRARTKGPSPRARRGASETRERPRAQGSDIHRGTCEAQALRKDSRCERYGTPLRRAPRPRRASAAWEAPAPP